VQLGQLTRYDQHGEGALQSGWVQVGSVATVFKLVGGIATVLFLIVLVAIWVGRGPKPA
jgi:hypothetical protein